MIPRGKLIGMQVYNPNGTFIGTVQDIALPLGGGEMGIQILTRAQTTYTIEWSKISAVGDIIILKENIELPAPAATTVTPQTVTPVKEEKGKLDVITGVFKRKEKPSCPTCGKPLTYIEQYKRWYCYNCSRYV
ncbi:MAG: PRC-barrel domain-containing protein [Aigarchaeota archaeon]|nr:PRC-barrel domain-containing protein [Aigarchaeota archaeon]MCX8193554.1 PRC-barrel domain-containing protein [Nitrososphaeria archaeon]MDW7986694.1 PRC-barrel domain-containing protein [Nitrososphaerota archaeon]